MTPSEKLVIQSLCAVAWADGQVQAPEAGMIDGLLWAFDASEAEEAELQEFVKTKRTLATDVPVDRLTPADKELLLAHAALLTHADGKQTKAEKEVLTNLIATLGLEEKEAQSIVKDAKNRAKSKAK